MTTRPRGRPRKNDALRFHLQVRLSAAHMEVVERVARERGCTDAEAVRYLLEEQGPTSLLGAPSVATATAPKTSGLPMANAGLAGFSSSPSGTFRAHFDGWNVSVSRAGARSWRWYAYRGSELHPDDPSGRARTAEAAANAARRAVRRKLTSSKP